MSILFNLGKTSIQVGIYLQQILSSWLTIMKFLPSIFKSINRKNNLIGDGGIKVQRTSSQQKRA